MHTKIKKVTFIYKSLRETQIKRVKNPSVSIFRKSAKIYKQLIHKFDHISDTSYHCSSVLPYQSKFKVYFIYEYKQI